MVKSLAIGIFLLVLCGSTFATPQRHSKTTSGKSMAKTANQPPDDRREVL